MELGKALVASGLTLVVLLLLHSMALSLMAQASLCIQKQLLQDLLLADTALMRVLNVDLGFCGHQRHEPCQNEQKTALV